MAPPGVTPVAAGGADEMGESRTLTPGFSGPVVVLGHTGFIGRALSAFLREHGASVHGLSSAELNMRDPAAFTALDELTGPDTTLLVCAALTPDRGANIATCVDHIGMTGNLAQYLS